MNYLREKKEKNVIEIKINLSGLQLDQLMQ